MAVAESITKYFEDFREKLLLDRDVIAEILIEGAEKAGEKADKTLEDIRELVGLN